ncbi:MAG TPA: long-chain fatty acid--CoA ligase [Thermoflexales bacterium]|nr:long-chain fatty acid--CoA ligase [Thermoflexales bacterium]
MLNLAMFVENQARRHPGNPAVVMGPMRLNYAQVNGMANQVANGLRAMGIQPGDKVALTCPNVPYFPVVYYGILKAGAVVVPLNVLNKGREIAYFLKDSDAKAYFCFEGTPELPMAQFGNEGFKEAGSVQKLIILTSNPAGPSPIEGVETLGMFIAKQPPTFDTVMRGDSDTAVILYTSGTTGQAKGAELTHSNMITNAIVSRDLHGMLGSERSSLLVALPLFHSFGQTCQMNAGFLQGNTIVLVPRFDPKAVLEIMVAEKINYFSGVPTMFWALLNYATQSGFDTSKVKENLKLCSAGGAALPVEVLNAFVKAFGVPILEGYGLSETAPVATFNQLDAPTKPGSIGTPVYGVDIRLVDDADKDVAVGELGEILIRGFNVMKGYYKRPEATAEAMRNGWFHTGDIAKKDEDGYLYIMDRKKDMIIRGGFNIYPRELEEVMITHPGVSLVAVVGMKDDALGEEVKAFVVRKPNANVTEAELMAWCKERMAAYKYPRAIEFKDALPMNATGKILKRELRG